MPTKTVTVKHPETHQATQEQYDEALAAAEIPDGFVVTRIVNESGVETRYTVHYGDDADPEKDVTPPAGDPAGDPPKRRRS